MKVESKLLQIAAALATVFGVMACVRVRIILAEACANRGAPPPVE
jgi:hypothetical protein